MSATMTTANKITILRILLIPFFVVEILYYVETGNEVHRLVGLLAFAVAAILDGVDGYVARHYHQQSELGTVLDPLADKLLLVSGIVVLSFDHAPRLGQIPLWLTGIIIGRDLLLGIGAVTVRFLGLPLRTGEQPAGRAGRLDPGAEPAVSRGGTQHPLHPVGHAGAQARMDGNW